MSQPFPGYHARPRDERDDPRHQTAMRTCLGCGEPFKSEWCGNRLCFHCAAAADRGSDVSVTAAGGRVRIPRGRAGAP